MDVTIHPRTELPLESKSSCQKWPGSTVAQGCMSEMDLERDARPCCCNFQDQLGTRMPHCPPISQYLRANHNCGLLELFHKLV